MELKQRFLNKVQKTDSCWRWVGGKQERGYGLIKINGKTRLAHRISYQLFKGELDDTLTIDHLCRNHSCVNPEHLEQVTIRENILRGEGIASHNARKTHCIRGHLLSGDDLHIRTDGKRYCLACDRIAKRERRKLKKMAVRA